MNDLQQLEQWAEPLLRKLSRTQRNALARTLGTELRRSQQQRIKAQQNPDGSDYAPRKLQEKTGHIKRRAMFAKLRLNKHLRTASNPSSVSVGFFSRVSRIARVHQKGLRDRVRKGGPEVKYEQRGLLGFSEQDKAFITDHLLEHFRPD